VETPKLVNRPFNDLGATAELDKEMVTLTPPGDIFRVDYRNEKVLKHHGDHSSAPKPLKLLQWNIERGYQLPGIIEELRKIDADVISLQEVDVLCERSGGVDTGILIAMFS
jgi:hypothetical protein